MAHKEYSTAEVAALFGVHPNTVRFYERWELIAKPERRANGYRVFTEQHIRQIRLARTAFKIEVVQNGLRQKAVDIVKTAARGDYDGAMLLAREYLTQLRKERANAEEAINIACGVLSGDAEERPMTRKETAEHLEVTTDVLRNWEMNGLLSVKRRENGYRIYSADDINRLKMIRALRCANYSLEAILRMLRQLSEDPNADIRRALNSPERGEEIVSVCDRLLISLGAAEKNAQSILAMLQEMKAKL